MTKFQKLEAEYQHLLSEYNILKCKLECKTDALLILCHEQEQFRSEKDQYKLMADQLRERYCALKRRVEGWGPSLLGVYDLHGWKGEREQSLVQLLCELKVQNKTLQNESDELKQSLVDAHGDVKMLREENLKSRSGSAHDEAVRRNILCMKEELLENLEKSKQKCQQLEKDLQALLDEKEELVTARDAFRHKFERLNQQLNCLLRGDQHSYVDIDGVVMENRYLKERIKQVVEEKNMAAAALSRCKGLLEKKRSSSSLRFSSIIAGLTVSAKQVEQLLQNSHFFEKSVEVSSSNDVRNLVLVLLEALSDNSLALSHQKKTNKILGRRVSELEEKIKNLEATTLWRFQNADHLSYLSNSLNSDKGKSCENLSSSPIQALENGIADIGEDNEIDDDVDLADEKGGFSPVKGGRDFKNKGIDPNFNDLDLLPMKDDCSSDAKFGSDTRKCDGNSQPGSPIHLPVLRTNSVHSDSELDAQKSLDSKHHSSSLQSSPIYERRDSLDIDDLPPALQKLLMSALSDIENGLAEQNGAENPLDTQSPADVIDPNC